MENQIIIITTKKELKATLSQLIEKIGIDQQPDFESDRITRTEACRLAQISAPTMTKRIREGIYKVYGSKRKQYLLRSEFIDALRNEEVKQNGI